jgi:hypothetical protein
MDKYPLVLCGPIVRHTAPKSVCVWVALQKRCAVELTVFDANAGKPGPKRLRCQRYTIQLGPNLHVVAVTATPESGERPLEWGENYLYDLRFGFEGVWQGLYDEGILRHNISQAGPLERLLYEGQSLPGFRLRSQNLDALRLIHGSCRKAHGKGHDALAILDGVLAGNNDTPQLLVLTGDQIYADDVDPALLQAIMDRSAELFGGEDRERTVALAPFSEQLLPGRRQELMADQARFTGTEAASHLVTLAEYCTMYLFAWSDILWGSQLGTEESLRDFRQTLPRARRVFANLSTYMIFDDHEVTDDWYRTQNWVNEVANSRIGSRVIRNALISYALFQHWGNAPKAFVEGTPGGDLIAAVDSWGDSDREKATSTHRYVYVPEPGDALEPVPPEALRWHFTVEAPGYRVVALDTRTRRHFRGASAAPGLMSRVAIDEALDPSRPFRAATIVASPTPVLGVRVIEFFQKNVTRLLDRYKDQTELVSTSDRFDAEAWAFDAETYDYLLERLATLRRVVILSGDVHYGFGASLVAKDRDARIVNFVSSALHNQTFAETVSKLLSWVGDRQLEALTDEAAAPTELPETVLAREVSTPSLSFEEDLLHEEGQKSEDAPPVDRGEIEFEAFPASRKRADVVGSCNLGDLVFAEGQALQRLRWQGRRGLQQTLHRATFPIEK